MVEASVSAHVVTVVVIAGKSVRMMSVSLQRVVADPCGGTCGGATPVCIEDEGICGECGPNGVCGLGRFVIKIPGVARHQVRAENVLPITTARVVLGEITAFQGTASRVCNSQIVRQEVNATQPPSNA